MKVERIARFVTSPVNDDEQFKALLVAFPVGTHFTQEQAVDALNGVPSATNAVYASQYLRRLSAALKDCPEGIQLRPAYGCVFTEGKG